MTVTPPATFTPEGPIPATVGKAGELDPEEEAVATSSKTLLGPRRLVAPSTVTVTCTGPASEEAVAPLDSVAGGAVTTIWVEDGTATTWAMAAPKATFTTF